MSRPARKSSDRRAQDQRPKSGARDDLIQRTSPCHDHAVRRRCALAFAVTIGACGDNASDADAGSSDGGAISIEDCDELTAQEECEAAFAPSEGDRCAWIDVRRPGATCDDTTVVPQCIGLVYVGAGCVSLDCPAGGETLDSFFRMVDGTVEVFSSPECGLGNTTADWTRCEGLDAVPECVCLCDG